MSRTWMAGAFRRGAVAVGLVMLLACTSGLGEPVRPQEAVSVELPAAPPDAVVLRLSVMPLPGPGEATLQASLSLAHRPAVSTPLGRWSLYPRDVAATFVARVPPALLSSSRAGQVLLLDVRGEGVDLASVRASWAGLPVIQRP